MEPDLLDGLEVFNGNNTHDSHNALADYWADMNGLIKTSGSDFHKADSLQRRHSHENPYPHQPGAAPASPQRRLRADKARGVTDENNNKYMQGNRSLSSSPRAPSEKADWGRAGNKKFACFSAGIQREENSLLFVGRNSNT